MMRLYFVKVVLMLLIQYQIQQFVHSGAVQFCESDDQCPDGSICLNNGKTSKAKKRCFQCCCQEVEQCTLNSKQKIECDCGDSGFEGPCCTINIDDCDPNPCLNGGTCVDGINNYTCSCPEGYIGRHCETLIPLCVRPNVTCGLTNASCTSEGSGCYFEENIEAFPNTWADHPDLVNIPNTASASTCGDLCAAFTDFQCLSYSYHPTSKACLVYNINPAYGLVTEYHPYMSFFSRTCLDC